MASADSNFAVKIDWPLANPWTWLAAGFGLVLWSWLWALKFEATASDYRVIVLAVGLLLTGAGLWLQWADRRTRHLLAIAPLGLVRLARLAMGAFYALLAGAVTVLLVLAIFQWEGLGFRLGVTLLLWLTVAPLSLCAARKTIDLHADRTPIDADEETGLAFVLAGLTTAIGSMTLWLGPQLVTDWDTIRLALRVLTAVTLTAGALAIVSIKVRRLVLSLVITLHFCGIATASLAAPPTPQLVQEIWVRIFRPYLEFMYLNNAYHFYAPEPGPQSYMWFRLIYTDENGGEVGRWEKVPNIDENGLPPRSSSVAYQRYVVKNETFLPTDPPPPMFYYNDDGQMEQSPVYARRERAAKGLADQAILGRPNSGRKYVQIPLHPDFQPITQLFIPKEMVKRLVASEARHVARQYAEVPGEPSLKFKSVKIYRVIHWIPEAMQLVNEVPPTDPRLYRPIYMGNFDRDGKLIDTAENDPYLYWLMPVLTESPNNPLAPIRDYCRRHAGDPNWVRHSIVENGKPPRYVWSKDAKALDNPLLR
jgi:hypothetical protein